MPPQQIENRTTRSSLHHLARAAFALRALVCTVLVVCCWMLSSARAQPVALHLPQPSQTSPITITAKSCSRWQQGAYEVWHLQGDCSLQQEHNTARSQEAIVWIDRVPNQPVKIIVYLESSNGEVTLEHNPGKLASVSGSTPSGSTIKSSTWFGRFYSTVPLKWQVPAPVENPELKPTIYDRGWKHFGESQTPIQPATALLDPAVQPAQFQAPPLMPTVPAPATNLPVATGFRKLQVFPRSDVGTQVEWKQLPSGENVAIVSGGVNIVVQGITVAGLPDAFGTIDSIDLETDRAVIWTAGLQANELGQMTQSSDLPLEIYMEGNIVFRQGDRTVYANRMYYDVRRQVGIVLNAELLTPLPKVKGYQHQGYVRLKADAIRQLDQSHFVAHNALITTSRLEEPTYQVGSKTIMFQDVQQAVVDPATGLPVINPATGQPIVNHRQLVESKDNMVKYRDFPIFYWPTLATDLEKPTFFMNNVRIRNDSIFGTQLLLDFDAFQLFGVRDKPDGTKWILSSDYLSDRGFAGGTSIEYDRHQFFNFLGPVKGFGEFWLIDDDGTDNLGLGRRAITPEESIRGRAFWNHRQNVSNGLFNGWIMQAEVGWLSDRTFLEQYYEHEWDNNKDQTTGGRLRRLSDNQSLVLEANMRVNNFLTQTQWLPRLDHYWLGQPLIDNSLTWFGHTSIGFANIGVASTPSDATLASFHTRLPWEDVGGVPISGKGERFATRHEIDMPLEIGALKMVPFVLGEFAHWGEDITGNDRQRAYVHTGVRMSVPFWSVNPAVQNNLFNLNGLAHKVVFDTEVSYSDANRNLSEFPLYDPLDDDSLEEFRRRLFFAPFGGSLAGSFDPRFDPRGYAFRTGIQGSVTSPTTEIVDDLATMRFGMRHRLQTKRGAPGHEHIVDWLTFDANATWFLREDRDNFGEEIGLVNYDLRWHLGDRFTVLSDGFADFFPDGLKTISVGVQLSRPTRGNAYFGFRTIDGPFSANVLTASYSYRVSPKWITHATASVDLGNTGNIGQSLMLSRLGESMIFSVGANVDTSKDNVGISFLIEPRGLPNLATSRKTGILIPPASAYGIE